MKNNKLFVQLLSVTLKCRMLFAFLGMHKHVTAKILTQTEIKKNLEMCQCDIDAPIQGHCMREKVSQI